MWLKYLEFYCFLNIFFTVHICNLQNRRFLWDFANTFDCNQNTFADVLTSKGQNGSYELVVVNIS